MKTKYCSQACVALFGLIVFAAASAVQASGLEVNLVQNGSFEDDGGTLSGVAPVGWIAAAGDPEVVLSPFFGISAPPRGGSFFLFGGQPGAQGSSTQIVQAVDLSEFQSLIDASQASFYASAFFAGFLDNVMPQSDYAQMDLFFLDASGASLSGFTLGGPSFNTPSVFVNDEQSGLIPESSRSVRIELESFFLEGRADADGYVDLIQFSVGAVPEPGSAILLFVGMTTMLICRDYNCRRKSLPLARTATEAEGR